MMFVYYRSSLPFGRLFFAVTKADDLIGRKVKVRGWYRRGIKPYVELSRIETPRVAVPPRIGDSLFPGEPIGGPPEYDQITGRSYSVWVQLAATAACVALGLYLLLP